jgi:cyclase
LAFRVIARLDVKPPNLVKGVHMEGLRRLGRPVDFANKYFRADADEINYQDIVASLFGRNSLGDLVSETAQSIFVPVTVGGGIRSVEDAAALVRRGADKVSLNTAAIRTPGLIAEISALMGRQAVVVGVEAMRSKGTWLAMTDNGREHTGRSVAEWLEEVQELGAGEVLLTSIDKDGTMKGIDAELVAVARARTSLPLVIHGGVGTTDDVVEAHDLGADAIALAAALHYGKLTVREIKVRLANHGVEVRPCASW